jgi:hypothetical protein
MTTAKPSKWHQGTTGQWDYRPRHTARRNGWKLTVEQMRQGQWAVFGEHKGGAFYNSLWPELGGLAYKTAEAAMRKAEAMADDSRVARRG